jgi:cytochrome c556
MLGALVAGAVMIGFGSGYAMAQDKEAVVKERRELMKSLGKRMATIKEFAEGKTDQAQATASAGDLAQLLKVVPSKFPAGTSLADFPGKTGAKPAIWNEFDRFTAATDKAAGEAEMLLAALKSGDKEKAVAQFAKTGKEGCGGCHSPYREKLDK